MHAMNRFSFEYQPFLSSQKETMVVNVFDTRYCFIIYMMAHNIISKKTDHSEVQKSDIYFFDYIFHNREFLYARIPLPKIIISFTCSIVRRCTTFFKLTFPRLPSLVFERVEVNLAGVVHEFVHPSTELSLISLRSMDIDVAAIPQPIRKRRSKTRHGRDEAGSSTVAPPPSPPLEPPQSN